MTKTGLLLALLATGTAAIPGFAADADAPDRLSFAVYAAGLNVLNIVSDVTLAPRLYRIDLNFKTAGLIGAFIHSDMNSYVQGGWKGNLPMPQRFANWGIVRGDVRRTLIDYHDDQPVVVELQPRTEENRDPVPPAMEHDTMDTLSAMAMLVRAVAETGRCEGHVVTFDGRRVLDITSHTGGMETLEKEGRSSFAGPALRCDLDGLQTAGFEHDVSEEELHRIHHSTAWVAQILPGRPALPVRVMFENNLVGHATAYLTGAMPTPPGPSASGVSR